MSPKTVPSGQKRAISGHESERRYLESLIRTDYERCHPNDSFEDLKRRAHFAKGGSRSAAGLARHCGAAHE
jgi:hypothetical protein